MKRPSIRQLSAANVDTQSIDFDFSEGYPEKWEYIEAAMCDKCNKVLIGRGGEEHHNDIDENSECDGYVNCEGPMMNYYYPIDLDSNDLDEAAKKIVDLSLCIVTFEDSDTIALALTGGGMNFSWEICEAYMRLGFLPPLHFSDLPGMAGRGTSSRDKWIIAGCRRSAKWTRDNAYYIIKKLAQFNKKEAVK